MLVVMLVQQLVVQINLDQAPVLLALVQVKFDHNKAFSLLKDHAPLVVERVQLLKTHVLNALEQGI